MIDDFGLPRFSAIAVDNCLITTAHQFDAMNTGQAAVIWLRLVGIGSIKAPICSRMAFR